MTALSPDIAGDTGLITNAAARQRVLAFGSWLEPDKAKLFLSGS